MQVKARATNSRIEPRNDKARQARLEDCLQLKAQAKAAGAAHVLTALNSAERRLRREILSNSELGEIAVALDVYRDTIDSNKAVDAFEMDTTPGRYLVDVQPKVPGDVPQMHVIDRETTTRVAMDLSNVTDEEMAAMEEAFLSIPDHELEARFEEIKDVAVAAKKRQKRDEASDMFDFMAGALGSLAALIVATTNLPLAGMIALPSFKMVLSSVSMIGTTYEDAELTAKIPDVIKDIVEEYAS